MIVRCFEGLSVAHTHFSVRLSVTQQVWLIPVDMCVLLIIMSALVNSSCHPHDEWWKVFKYVITDRPLMNSPSSRLTHKWCLGGQTQKWNFSCILHCHNTKAQLKINSLEEQHDKKTLMTKSRNMDCLWKLSFPDMFLICNLRNNLRPNTGGTCPLAAASPAKFLMESCRKSTGW